MKYLLAFLWLVGLVLLLALLISTSNAADFLTTLDDYERGIRRTLGVGETNTTYYTDSTLHEFIREGLVRTNDLVPLDQNLVSFVTAYRKSAYALDTMTSQVLAVWWSKNDSQKVFVRVPMEKWYEQMQKTTVNQNNAYDKRPSYYDVDDSLLYIYPAPTVTSDTIKVRIGQKLQNLSAAVTLTALPQKYREAVLACACWLAAEGKQHPLTNVLKQRYDEAIAALRGPSVQK